MATPHPVFHGQTHKVFQNPRPSIVKPFLPIMKNKKHKKEKRHLYLVGGRRIFSHVNDGRHNAVDTMRILCAHHPYHMSFGEYK